jgi:hypothetical protein
MSDQTPTLERINAVSDETCRRLFGEAIDEAIKQHGLQGDEADTLRMCSWAAYERIDMKALGYKLKTGEITMADAMAQCLPTVAQILSAGMQGSRRLH